MNWLLFEYFLSLLLNSFGIKPVVCFLIEHFANQVFMILIWNQNRHLSKKPLNSTWWLFLDDSILSHLLYAFPHDNFKKYDSHRPNICFLAVLVRLLV
jgi:DNA polymerase IIIc chi subunit